MKTHSLDKWIVTAPIAAGVAIAGLYALLVHAGTPGDEPAHWANVLYYSSHFSMPVLGHPGVGYEAQMGPLYYVLASIPVRILGANPTSFYLLRLIDCTLVIPLVLLAFRTARLVSASRWLPLAVAGVVAMNPTLMAMAGSVQNDVVTLVLSWLAIYLGLKWLIEDRLSLRNALVVGALVGLAVLAKATAAFLVAAIPIGWIVIARRRAWAPAVLLAVTAMILSGWTFVRNQILYGDFTAQSALTKFHYHNNPPPIQLWQPRELAHWLYVFNSYSWAPTEYFRDVFHQPLDYRVLVLGFAVAALAGLGLAAVRNSALRRALPELDSNAVKFLGVQFAVCVAVYVYTCVRVTYFAPRTTFPVLGIYLGFLVAGIVILVTSLRRPGLLLSVPIMLVLLNGQELLLVHQQPHYPFDLFVR